MSAEKILIIEDDAVVMAGLKTNLLREGYQVFGAGNGREAIDLAQSVQPALVLLDLTLPGVDPNSPWQDGFAVLGWLRRTLPGNNFPVIIHTGDCSPGVAARAKGHGVYALFHKGCNMGELLRTIRTALAAKAG